MPFITALTKTLRNSLFLLVLLSNSALSDNQAPDFTLPQLSNERPLTLSSAQGQWVYLDFWASWCSPCGKSFPWMNQLANTKGLENLHIIAVSVDQHRRDALAFISKHPVTFDVVWDGSGDTPAAYGVKAMPSSYLIDPAGQVRWVHLGFKEADKKVLQTKILDLMAGE